MDADTANLPRETKRNKDGWANTTRPDLNIKDVPALLQRVARVVSKKYPDIEYRLVTIIGDLLLHDGAAVNLTTLSADEFFGTPAVTFQSNDRKRREEDGPVHIKPGYNIIDLENGTLALLKAEQHPYGLIYHAAAFLQPHSEGSIFWNEQ